MLNWERDAHKQVLKFVQPATYSTRLGHTASHHHLNPLSLKHSPVLACFTASDHMGPLLDLQARQRVEILNHEHLFQQKKHNARSAETQAVIAQLQGKISDLEDELLSLTHDHDLCWRENDQLAFTNSNLKWVRLPTFVTLLKLQPCPL